MALIKCKSCGGEMSNEAAKCPHCGHPNKQQQGAAAVVSLLVFGGFLWFFFFGGWEWQTTREINKIEKQVASDAVRQYNIAEQQGDAMQTCVQAGLVSAAFLQAEDQANYNKWKVIEKTKCKAAGIPY